MNRKLPPSPTSADDAMLHDLLKRHDPMAPPTQAFLAALEKDILASINTLPKTSRPKAGTEHLVPIWMVQQGLTLGGLVLAALLIIMSGFIFGHASYDGASLSSSTTQSLLAFADEPLMQFVPVINTLRGDKNEDDE
jgi:hypothetical protein